MYMQHAIIMYHSIVTFIVTMLFQTLYFTDCYSLLLVIVVIYLLYRCCSVFNLPVQSSKCCFYNLQ